MPLHSSHYWLLRAEEARAMAEDMHDEFAKQTMMDVVTTYEKLAAYTRSLEKDGKPSASAADQPASS